MSSKSYSAIRFVADNDFRINIWGSGFSANEFMQMVLPNDARNQPVAMKKCATWNSDLDDIVCRRPIFLHILKLRSFVQLDGIKKYMRFRHVDMDMQHRVFEWASFMWEGKKFRDNEADLQILPVPLQKVLLIAAHMDTFQVSLIYNTSTHCIFSFQPEREPGCMARKSVNNLRERHGSGPTGRRINHMCIFRE